MVSEIVVVMPHRSSKTHSKEEEILVRDWVEFDRSVRQRSNETTKTKQAHCLSHKMEIK